MYPHALEAGAIGQHRPLNAVVAIRFRPAAAAGEPRTIDRSEEVALVRRAKSGDRAAVERLVEAHVRLISREARRHSARTQSYDDLLQEGLLAFVGALDGYDPDQGHRLMTYALHWVRRAIARAVAQDRESRFAAEVEIVSLEARVGSDSESTLMELLEDPDAADPEQNALQSLSSEQIRSVVGDLPDRERRVVEERFGFGDDNPRTVEEISRRLRIPRERIRRIEAAAMQRLRTVLADGQWD